ncbi:hypothetical protein KC906_01495 [Candidatus Kaiserbacteria bacterium]|nr:hypothetical protein [Candidatus Kaiserbacteria bacterium]MCB9812679.1 hypothetical protein [Candidatus Nomurabacteria bacterium]
MLDPSQLNFPELPLHTVVLGTFYLVLGAYAIFTAIFYYHWRTYGTDVKVTTYTLVVYFSTTIPLLVVMGVLAFIL